MIHFTFIRILRRAQLHLLVGRVCSHSAAGDVGRCHRATAVEKLEVRDNEHDRLLKRTTNHETHNKRCAANLKQETQQSHRKGVLVLLI